MMKYDYLIVGSGLFGATFAYKAHQLGKKCLVIDKRPHLGGNVYCENIEGINVHKYGAHIFHTSNKAVWEFVNSIVPFNQYINAPLANYNGVYYNLPFNMNTFYQMWGVKIPQEAIDKIEEQKKQASHYLTSETPCNLEEQAISLIGTDIYEKLIKGYTEKQWGRKCTDLPPFIIKRLPVRFSFNNNYFNDNYQGIPIGGYNKLIDGLLDGIEVMINTDFFADRARFKEIAHTIVYTGPIDEYYEFVYGKLQYRSVEFKQEIHNVANYQGNAVINFTDSVTPYTRIIEHKHFEYFGEELYSLPKTVISKEYSLETKDKQEPYYPINDSKNEQTFKQYEALSKKESNIIFGGRLAEYKYYDMDKVIENVLKLFA